MDITFVVLIVAVLVFSIYNVIWRYKVYSNDISSDLFSSIQYVMRNDLSSAEAIFVKLINNDPHIVGTYIALGNVYRLEGKFDQAISVHEQITAKKSLKKAIRFQALTELATDYLCAGILDKAEDIFLQTKRVNTHSIESLKGLLSIYKKQSKWHQARLIIETLQAKTATDYMAEYLHLYCEEITGLLALKQLTKANAKIQEAMAIDSDHLRLNILCAKHQMQLGFHGAAITRLKQMIMLHDKTILIMLAQLIPAYIELGKIEYIAQYMQVLIERSPMVIAIHIIQLIDRFQLPIHFDMSIVHILEKLPENHPLLLLWPALNMTHFKAYTSLLSLHYANNSFQCTHCGFKEPYHVWRCVSCDTWDSFVVES